MVCEVYMHTSPSGKSYVGWTSRGWRVRWADHVNSASRLDTAMARAIRKYGAEAFEHRVLETCPTRADAAAAEQRWIAELGTQVPAGYNSTAGGDGALDLTPEAREKRVAAWTSDRRAAAASRAGDDPERLVRARRALASKPVSAETRAKRSAALKGRPKTREWRAKVSATHTGKKRPQSPEHKAALAASWTPERRAAAAARARARVVSSETRSRLSAAATRQHARARGEEL